MRALILSDIHCVSRDLVNIPDSKGYHGVLGSNFFIEDRTKHRNRILALEPCLEDEFGRIDVILCLGDFAHQSKQLPLLQSWNDIRHVAAALGIPKVVGITGNHDLASRVEDMNDAEQRLEFLRSIPDFPTDDQTARLSYFSQGYCCIEIGDVLIVAIDTCRVHGLGKDEAITKRIWSRGHITTSMIGDVCTAIRNSDKNHVILIMHHHPEKVDATTDPDFDQMLEGSNFLHSLGEIQKAIFVLHGHKHLVRLKRASTGTNPPIVLSAASLAAHPYPAYGGSHYANQFHILEIDLSQTKMAYGRVLSWDWGSSKWEPSKKPDMPHSLPFGPTISLPDLAAQIGALGVISQLDLPSIRAKIPTIDYFQISQQDELNSLLSPYGCEIICYKSEVFALVKR